MTEQNRPVVMIDVQDEDTAAVFTSDSRVFFDLEKLVQMGTQQVMMAGMLAMLEGDTKTATQAQGQALFLLNLGVQIRNLLNEANLPVPEHLPTEQDLAAAIKGELPEGMDDPFAGNDGFPF